MSASRSVRELEGKVAIVTGAAHGIGRATAELFANAGASVVLTDMDDAEGNAAAKAIAGKGGKAIFVHADHGSESDWRRVIDATLSAFGRVDILVANAGILSAAPAAEMKLEEFRRLNRVNLKGPFFGLKHAVEAMRRHGEGGAIVLTSSVAGKVGLPAHVHYCASKGGVRMMAKAAALELGPEKIRVNSIHPGYIRTRMTANASRATDGGETATVSASVPLGRPGEPAEIAKGALFLVSPRGRFITGTELVIDGGWTAQ